MKPEQYFLKYSYPTAQTLYEMGSISDKKLAEIKKHVLSDKSLSRTELMMLFPSTFVRIVKLADEMKKEVWDIKVMKSYFMDKHNSYVDEIVTSDLTKNVSDFRKVFKGRIIVKDGDMLTVEYEDRHRQVLSDLVPDAKPGDKVTIHQGFAVEKLD